jgi:hypothetical protein
MDETCAHLTQATIINFSRAHLSRRLKHFLIARKCIIEQSTVAVLVIRISWCTATLSSRRTLTLTSTTPLTGSKRRNIRLAFFYNGGSDALPIVQSVACTLLRIRIAKRGFYGKDVK